VSWLINKLTLVQIAENSQISMTGYVITRFGAGDEVKEITEVKVETTGRNEGHPKLHGCSPESLPVPERIYDLSSRPPSPDMIFARDLTVWIFG